MPPKYFNLEDEMNPWRPMDEVVDEFEGGDPLAEEIALDRARGLE